MPRHRSPRRQRILEMVRESACMKIIGTLFRVKCIIEKAFTLRYPKTIQEKEKRESEHTSLPSSQTSRGTPGKEMSCIKFSFSQGSEVQREDKGTVSSCLLARVEKLMKECQASCYLEQDGRLEGCCESCVG